MLQCEMHAVYPWYHESFRTFKNCEECAVLQYFKGDTLARYCFGNAGRRHGTSGSETKGFMTHSKHTAWVSCFYKFPLPPKSQEDDVDDEAQLVTL